MADLQLESHETDDGASVIVRGEVDMATAPQLRDTLETVALLVTELVTNAILHARTPLLLTLESRPDHVRISVADRSNDQPAVRSYESDAVTGRGLALVEQLATTWGVDTTPSGKVVWCEVPV